MVKLAFCNLLLLLLSISFCASAQHQLGAEQTKRFSIAYQVNDLLGSKEVDVAEQVIDSLCLAHANDQELVGVIRVSMMDWLRYKPKTKVSKHYLMALRRVNEPFYQRYILENHYTNRPFYGSSEIPLFEKTADSVATSLVTKVPDTESYELRGRLRFANEDFKNALVDFENAVRLSYGRPNLRLLDYIADTYSKVNKYPEAIKYYTMQVDSSKNKRDVLWHRGLCKRELEDYRGALSDFSRALLITERQITSVSDYFLLTVSASCKLSLGENLDAKVLLNKVPLQQIPQGDSGYFYYLKGLADYHLKYKESACANWSKAGEHGYAEAYEAIKSYCNKH